MRNFRWIFVGIIIAMVSACGDHDKEKSSASKVITVEPQSLSTPLFFSGTIQPLKTVVVTSPGEGVIDDMAFHYGDAVSANKLLFMISSEKFKSDYKTALMQYIKAKNEFSNARSQLKESEFLHKNQLISDDDFKSKQSNYYNAQLSLVQAQDAVGIMLKQLAVPGINLNQLTIENIDKITQALNMQGGSQRLRVVSPVAGVVLLPTKSGSTDDTKKIEKGDQVKQGDVLAVIGDVSGLTLHINVNEFNINQLKLGQKVKVTGAAFPDMVLEGSITGLDKQGQASTGGMPVFPVEIVVPKLTAAQQATIHIGMSAKVQIDIGQPQQITLPLAAIIQKKGNTYVRVQEGHFGATHEVQVKTGQTTLDSVVIESGLQAGDKVLVTH
jgi:HlyD family secretion protein